MHIDPVLNFSVRFLKSVFLFVLNSVDNLRSNHGQEQGIWVCYNGEC